MNSLSYYELFNIHAFITLRNTASSLSWTCLFILMLWLELNISSAVEREKGQENKAKFWKLDIWPFKERTPRQKGCPTGRRRTPGTTRTSRSTTSGASKSPFFYGVYNSVKLNKNKSIKLGDGETFTICHIMYIYCIHTISSLMLYDFISWS